MKIGIFDSGLGGLAMTKVMEEHFPQHDYVYFGDTKNLPYGDKTPEEIKAYTEAAVDYLLGEAGCGVVVLACNTANSIAIADLRAKHGNNIFGVVHPTVKSVCGLENANKVYVISTVATANSGVFQNAFAARHVMVEPSPLLVSMLENDEISEDNPALLQCIRRVESASPHVLVLGCTHFILLKELFRKNLPESIKIISQDEIMIRSFREFLEENPEVASKLSKNSSRSYLVTKLSDKFNTIATRIFGHEIPIKEIKI